MLSGRENMQEKVHTSHESGTSALRCPQCQGTLTIIQLEPIYDETNAYVPYRTVVECASCSYRLVTESYTILGGIKNVDSQYVEIGSWGPSGSRVLSRFKYTVNPDLLRDLKKTQELVEFLILNEQVVQVIG
jgi:hypothetical protein